MSLYRPGGEPHQSKRTFGSDSTPAHPWRTRFENVRGSVPNDNTLTARPSTAALVQVARLYLLTRDAYLSSPTTARLKLDGLDDLCATVGSHLMASGLPVDVRATTGVRLVDTLRTGLDRASRTTVRQERELTLIDVLTTTHPGHSTWAAPVEGLAVDLASLLLPETTPVKAAHLVRRHDAATRRLAANLHRARPRPTVDAPVDVVADMISGVYGLNRPAALCAAITSLDGDDTPTTTTPAAARRSTLCGGALFHRLHGPDRPALHRYVGGALALRAPDAFAHQVATIDLVRQQRPDLVDRLRHHVDDVRADITATRALDPEAASAAVRSLDMLDKSMRPRRVLGTRLRHHLRTDRLGGLRSA